MISALIINLDSSVDRWKFQKEQCERLGLPYERISACDKKDINDAQYKLLGHSWQRPLSRGELACFLSHYGLWQKVVQDNKPYFILEDDALLCLQIMKVMPFIEQQKEIDFLNLEARGRKILLSKQGNILVGQFSIKKVFQAKNGAAAYILWPSGAKKLCDLFLRKNAALADAFIAECDELINTQIFPALAIQLDRTSYYDVSVNELGLLAMPTVLGTGRKEKRKTFQQGIQRFFVQLKLGLKFLNMLKGAKYNIIPFYHDAGNRL